MTVDLLWLAAAFFIIALLAYVLGARGLSWFSEDLAKTIIRVFLILLILTLIFRGI